MKTLLTGILILFCFQALAVGQLKPGKISNPDDLRIDPAAADRFLSDAEIRKVRVSLTVRDAAMGEMLYMLAVRSGVPIGLEVAGTKDDSRDFAFNPALFLSEPYSGADIALGDNVYGDIGLARRRFSVDFKVERLEVILDELVRKMNGYVWWTEDGIINMAPEKRDSPLLRELMSRKIKEFRFPAGRSIRRLMDAVKELPELKRFRVAMFHPGGVGADKLTIRDDLYIRDVTFKELLNKLAKVNGCGWFASPVSVGDSEIMRFSF